MKHVYVDDDMRITKNVADDKYFVFDRAELWKSNPYMTRTSPTALVPMVVVEELVEVAVAVWM